MARSKKRRGTHGLPPEVVSILEAVAERCPRLPNGRRVTVDDFEVRPAEDSSGWFFRCSACGELKCVGFIPKGAGGKEPANA